MILAALGFSLMGGAAKLLKGTFSAGQLVFFPAWSEQLINRGTYREATLNREGNFTGSFQGYHGYVSIVCPAVLCFYTCL
jgi:hypothetical protein